MIKAIFFDIDGTLKPFDENELRETTVKMLAELQEKGIRIFVASGRPPEWSVLSEQRKESHS